VGEGGLQLGVVEPLGGQPALMLAGPAGPGAIDPSVAQQERVQASAGAATVVDQVGAGATQVTDRFLPGCGDADGDQLAGPVQARRRQSRRSVLTLSPTARGVSDGAITSQRTPWRCSSRASS